MKYFPLKCVKSIRSFICIDCYLIRRMSVHSNIYVKYLFCIVLIYLINLFFGLHYYLWSERSFEDEYHRHMRRIDLDSIDENHPEKVLGPAKYLLPNEFLIENEDLCLIKKNNRRRFARVLILVKSAFDNFHAREAIRLTWANRNDLNKYSIRLAFVLGNDRSL